MTFAWTWRRCVSAVRRHPTSAAALCGAFALLTLLAGAARLVDAIADAVVPRLADNVHVIAYLRDDMTADRAGALGELVSHVPGVARVRQVDSEEALRRLRAEAAALGGVAELLDGVEEGFLPRSLEIALAPSDSVSQRAAALAERLRRIPGIAEVDAMEDGLARLRSVLGLARVVFYVLLALAVVAGVASLLLPLLQARQRRREEVDVLTMLGETRSGIAVPWSMIGAAAALCGSGGAWLVLWVAHANVAPAASRLLDRWTPVALPFIDPSEMAAATAAAVVLGIVVGRCALPSLGRVHG